MKKERVIMPRPKGSKNKKSRATESIAVATDYAALIAEKQSAREALEAEIAAVTDTLSALKADLKEKNASLKQIDKEIAKLSEKKAKEEAAALEAAKKAELETVLNQLMAGGMSAADILEKLK